MSITPDPAAIPYPLGGYIASNRLKHSATGIRDTCYARALALAVGRTRCVVVSLDLCFVPAGVKKAVMERLAGTGLPSSALFMAATHTHSATDPLLLHPGNIGHDTALPKYDPRLLAWFADHIAGVVREALRNLRPARLGSGQARIIGLNRNRRDEKLTDDEMTCLKVTDPEGHPLAAVIIYAAHPTIYGAEMLEVSADWPGELSRRMEEALPGATVLFLNGAEGDAAVKGVDDGEPLEKVRAYAGKLAMKVHTLYTDMVMMKAPKLSAWTQAVAAGKPQPHPFFVLAAAQFNATSAQARAFVSRMMPERSSVAFMRIGDVLLVGMPGEPTAAVGLEAKRMARLKGTRHPAVVALTNDWLGYLVTAAQYRAGKYEATMSFYGPGIGAIVLQAVRDGMAREKTRK